jgi:hypothetical protein
VRRFEYEAVYFKDANPSVREKDESRRPQEFVASSATVRGLIDTKGPAGSMVRRCTVLDHCRLLCS